MAEFRAGDVVVLRAGGPPMTVENIGEVALTGEDGVWCVWTEMVDAKTVLRRDTFPPIVLKIYEAADDASV